MVKLIPASPGHAAVLARALKDAALSNFSFFEEPVTVEREREYLARIAREGSHLYMIENDEGRVIGTAGLHEVDIINRTARVGMTIFREEDRHSHYGHDAIVKLIDRAFGSWNLQKLYANILATNQKQIEWDTALGFKKEGYLKNEYYLQGKYHDMVRLALLRDDWLETHKDRLANNGGDRHP